MGERLASLFEWVGDRSFLVFFVHVVVLERVADSAAIVAMGTSTPTFLIILIVAIATFLISLGIATAIRFIPGSKAVLG
jgi:fucose 4-O-acetylase-like acetyltransferase